MSTTTKSGTYMVVVEIIDYSVRKFPRRTLRIEARDEDSARQEAIRIAKNGRAIPVSVMQCLDYTGREYPKMYPSISKRKEYETIMVCYGYSRKVAKETLLWKSTDECEAIISKLAVR